MYLYKCELNFLRKKYEEKMENAYLPVKSATASGALSPRPLAYRLMYLQTKQNEQIRPLIFSDKEKEYCICQNGQNLLY